MPSGAGKKGGKVPRKKAVNKPILTDENRVPLDTQASGRSTGNVNVSVKMLVIHHRLHVTQFSMLQKYHT